jgi:cyclic pyranopterin phosphate synthase
MCDRFGRRIEYLRLSVTDRCDLRCSYCMPRGFEAFEAPASWLTFDETERIVAAFARLGVQRVRLTGGEPLLRRELPALARRLGAIPGIADLSLSTNGTQLERHAAMLRRAGVARLNVSLDSLRPERVRQITGRDVLAQVLRGLAAAKAEGFSPIKINMVPLAGVNDDEIDAMVEFCLEHGFVLRLIEVMPIGAAGRQSRRLELAPVRERLARRYGLVAGVIPGGGPARYLKSPDGGFSVGFITPISQHFCDTCNRVRVGVDGTLHLCLGAEARVELRARLRAGISDGELEATILRAIEFKPRRHDFSNPASRVIRVMAATGG